MLYILIKCLERPALIGIQDICFDIIDFLKYKAYIYLMQILIVYAQLITYNI
jgi:hypothetical protein